MASIGHRGFQTIVSAGVCAAAMALGGAATAQEPMRGSPEDVGMSSERLERIGDLMQSYIDEGRITGGVTAVARRGQLVHFEAHGLANIETAEAMPENAIFRMMSSTKPTIGVAVLRELELGHLRLTDPVSRFIPEFADAQVAVRGEDGEIEVVPADRDITVQDLLTHTSGLLSGGAGGDVVEVNREEGDTLATFIPRLGAVPLDFQPGTQWDYSASAGIDVLARIVEITSGQPIDEYLDEHVFTPLGMDDTGFNVPESKRDRVLTRYFRREGEWATPPSFAQVDESEYFSGGGGLFSTAMDYARFESMLVNGGSLNGRQILSPRTVEMMAAAFVSDEMYDGTTGDDEGQTFGLTVATMRDPVAAQRGRSAGAFGWAGAYGTISWTDPAEEMIAVLMIQQRDVQLQRDFEYAVRQAIIE